MRWALWVAWLCCLLGALPAWADSGSALRRFALIVGSNDGGAPLVTLRYAGTDAEAVADVLQNLGGVREEDTLLLIEPGVSDIHLAFEDLSDRIRDARGEADRVEVVLYYSGHANVDGLLPHGETYSYGLLRTELARLDVDVRVVIVDACESGALIRAKGGQKRAPFLVDQANALHGEAYLTSSTADEASQESDAIRASYFTHHLLAGLRGAADHDGDGLITLSEAYGYTFRETRQSTEGSRIGPQSPGWSLNLIGQGDVVLSDLRASTSTLTLDAGLDGDVWIRRSDGRLLAELRKYPGKTLVMSVPEDAYRLTLRSADVMFAAKVDVSSSMPAALAASDWRRMGTGVDYRTRGDTADPPRKTVRFNMQFVGSNRFGKKAGTRVTGLALHGLRGMVHSLDGVALSALGTEAVYDVRGAQIGVGWTASKGDVTGLQWSSFANVARGSLNGLQLSFVVNEVTGDSPDGTFGAQLAGVGNIGRGGHRGAQVSTVFNVSGHALQGAQLTGAVNVAKGHITGAQVGFFGNYAQGVVKGWQWSGVFNAADGLRGLQLSTVNHARRGQGVQIGGMNVAKQLKGVQVGLINVADELDGEAVGVLNVIRNGYHSIELGTSDLQPIELSAKLGSKHIYTVFLVGLDPSGTVGLSFGGGLGAHAQLFESRAYVDVDVVARTKEAIPEAPSALAGGLVTSLRLTLGGDVVGPLGLWIGPAFHMHIPVGDAGLAEQSFIPSFAMGAIRGSVGYQAGLRLRF